MNRIHATTLALLLAGAAASPAFGYTCYTLYDRNDNVVYRDTMPPVDMGDEGKAVREALRARGQYLMFTDFDTCLPVEFKLGSAGSVDINVERTVGGVAAGSTAP